MPTQPAVRLAEIAPSMTLAIGSRIGSNANREEDPDLCLRHYIPEECAKVIYG